MRQSAALAGGQHRDATQQNCPSNGSWACPWEFELDAGVPFDSVSHNVAAGRVGR